MLRTDSHSPPPFRVKAPMAHFPAFATAFNCKPGDAMVAGHAIVALVAVRRSPPPARNAEVPFIR